MDNLARCAMAAKVKGMSYGRYQALYGKPVAKKEEVIPENWETCPWCGKKFKRKPNQIYCEYYCRSEAQKKKDRERKEALKNEKL